MTKRKHCARLPDFIPAGMLVRIVCRGYPNCVGELVDDVVPGGPVVVRSDDYGKINTTIEQIVLWQEPKPVSLRQTLPYGEWTCGDGRVVLFNRDYKPIWQRRPGCPADPGDPDERVDYEDQVWFYNRCPPPWLSKPTKHRLTKYLAKFCAA